MFKYILITAVLVLAFALPAHADGIDTANKAQGAKSESGILRLTPDKDVVVRLEQDASSVIVNNPRHASVLLDNPRLLIVMPRLPGTTSFSVLNAKGETIMQKTVIVSAAEKNYIRVRRACLPNDTSCNAAGYYYCPDGCYEVTPVTPGTNATTPPPLPKGSGGTAVLPPPMSPYAAPSPEPVEPAEPMTIPLQEDKINQAPPPLTPQEGGTKPPTRSKEPETGNRYLEPLGPNGEPDTSAYIGQGASL